MVYLPKRFTIVKGIGTGKKYLNSFDNALQNAGVGNFNLLKVSSILPPNTIEDNNLTIDYGSTLPIAYASMTSNILGTRIVAGIAVGIPSSNLEPGVIMEYSTNESCEDVENILKEMVIEAMENRNILIKEIRVSISEKIVQNYYETVFAGLALW